jgi:uncharacterized protein (DUF1697 family)
VPRYVSFLRGINVGGHRVTMVDLRRHFAALKFDDVATFIASGNVLFDSPNADTTKLEAAIETQLERALGYAVPTFIRTLAETGAASAWQPFAPADVANEAYSRYVMFVRSPLDAVTRRAIEQVSCASDEFRVNGREIHWLRRGKLSDETPASKEFGKVLRAAKVDGTLRNIKMLQRLVAQEGAGETSTEPNSAGRKPRRVNRGGKSPKDRVRKA